MTAFSQLSARVLLAAAVATGAYLSGALSRGGAIGAVVVGGLTFGVGGWVPAILLIFFFASSSLLSRLGRPRKRSIEEKFAKGSRRDAGQVVANGGLAAISAALLGWTGNELWLVGTLGALAAVTADTWATELGVLARSTPRRLTDWSPTAPGTSGAVTLEGTLAGIAGSAALGVTATLLEGRSALIVLAMAAGVMGSFVDSLLGTSVQARYLCPQCGRETERHPLHSCGSTTQFAAGWSRLNNDGVNFLASSVGWLTAVLLVRWVV